MVETHRGDCHEARPSISGIRRPDEVSRRSRPRPFVPVLASSARGFASPRMRSCGRSLPSAIGLTAAILSNQSTSQAASVKAAVPILQRT
jgi:hypothetical protein